MSHLKFVEVSLQGQVTKRFSIISAHDGSDIGLIKWHPGWRQYVLITPNVSCFWSWDCMKECSDFIKKLMDERKGL